MLMIFRGFLHGHVVSCLLDSFIRCVSVFLSVPSWPPADWANVLRGLSSQSPHRLEQPGTENFPGVYKQSCRESRQAGRSSFFDAVFRVCASVLVFFGCFVKAGAAEVHCNSPSNGNICAFKTCNLRQIIASKHSKDQLIFFFFFF